MSTDYKGMMMMTLYIYDNDTMRLVDKIEGIDNADCEAQAGDAYGDTDVYGWTYTPAFGFVGGVQS